MIQPAEPSTTPVLSVEGVSKSFPGVKALDGVSFEVRPGEVMALVGENGAGKSTLMKVIDGIYQPEEGSVSIGGETVALQSPQDAKRRGIAMIHQELSLVEDLSVAENLFLGELPRKSLGRVDWKKLYADSRRLLDRLNCQFSPRALIRNLTVAHKQLVEIARALVYETRVVIFDEPTTSLTDRERLLLFEIIRDLRSQGVGIVYISHKMDEIFELSDRITVLRDGTPQGVLETAETDEDSVVERMIGRKVSHAARTDFRSGENVVLQVSDLWSRGAFREVSFELRSGEILGFYGLIGSGRTEILEAIFGLRKYYRGEIRVAGERLDKHNPEEAIARGIALIPEDRKENGLALSLACDRNLGMTVMNQWGNLAHPSREKRLFEEYREKLSIKAPGPSYPVDNLSGGNQQKVVIGKWLATEPRILLVDEPTRGIDVGSKAQIHQLLRDLAAEGYAIIVVSSEMPEIIRVSDRVLSLYEGRIVSELVGEEISEESVGRAITGVGELASTAHESNTSPES